MEYAPPIGQETQGEAAIYIDGNPEAGIEGSAVPAKAIEPGMRELLHLIRFAGLTPSGTDMEQVRKAIGMLIESAAPGLATLLQPGLVRPDGTSCYMDEDLLRVPLATAEKIGLVKPDDTTITVDANGALTANINAYDLRTVTVSGSVAVPDGTTHVLATVYGASGGGGAPGAVAGTAGGHSAVTCGEVSITALGGYKGPGGNNYPTSDGPCPGTQYTPDPAAVGCVWAYSITGGGLPGGDTGKCEEGNGIPFIGAAGGDGNVHRALFVPQAGAIAVVVGAAGTGGVSSNCGAAGKGADGTNGIVVLQFFKGGAR